MVLPTAILQTPSLVPGFPGRLFDLTQMSDKISAKPAVTTAAPQQGPSFSVGNPKGIRWVITTLRIMGVQVPGGLEIQKTSAVHIQTPLFLEGPVILRAGRKTWRLSG